MESGFTIAFITKDKKGDSYTYFNLFGSKYWDDSKENKSRKGYYFAYYYRKEKVLIYRIERILPPEQRPVEMLDWDRGRNIQCFGDLLREFTWNEWIEDYGKGAPYSPKYGSSQTTAWSSSALRKKYPSFAFERLLQEVNKPKTIPKSVPNSVPNSVPESIQVVPVQIKELTEIKNSVKEPTTRMLTPCLPVSLGKYQMEWLNHYHKIDLTHWRKIYCDDPEWYYVGDWKPGKDQKLSFIERESNIRSDKYYYWPK